MVSHHGSQPVATPLPANDSMLPLLRRFAWARGAALTTAAGHMPATAAIIAVIARSDRNKREFIPVSFPSPRPARANRRLSAASRRNDQGLANVDNGADQPVQLLD